MSPATHRYNGALNGSSAGKDAGRAAAASDNKPVEDKPLPTSTKQLEQFVAVPAVQTRLKLKEKQRESISELQRVWQRLAVNILASNDARVPWVMGITSAIRGEGRTTAALGLTNAISRETGERVALVELDLENPQLSAELGQGSTPGLIQCLQDEAEFEDTYRTLGDGNVVLVPASTGLPQTPLSLSLDDLAVRLRHQTPALVATLKNQFKYTLVDLPPILSNMQTERVAISLNGTLIVVRSGVTPINLIQEAVSLVGEQNLLGAIQIGPPSPVPAWLSNLLAS